jgi:hypothetical protein
VRFQVVMSRNGCLVFDDSVMDKDHSHQIELVRRQYSGNEHAVIIKGIGVVNCLYVNPETGDYRIIDYRIFDPAGDGKTKPDHVQDMLTRVIADKRLPFGAVLMDIWYATKDLRLFIESVGKVYYCPSGTTDRWMTRLPSSPTAASTRTQATHGRRALRVPQGKDSAQPHRLRHAGLDSADRRGAQGQPDHLSHQARTARQLLASRAKKSSRSDGFCVSPD